MKDLRRVLLGGVLLMAPLAVARGAATAAPEAEVSASSGPVKLTFRVYKTKLKLLKKKVTETDFERLDHDYPHGTPGDFDSSGKAAKYQYEVEQDLGPPIWVQFGITNVGKNPILVNDSLFNGDVDFMEAIQNNSCLVQGGIGIFLTIIGPDGKPVNRYPHDKYKSPLQLSKPYDQSKLDAHGAAADREIKALVEKWKRAGYSWKKIDELQNRRWAEWNKKGRDWIEDQVYAEHPAKTLNPGESIWTKSFLFEGYWSGYKWTKPQPVGDYAELIYFDLNKPGTYRIRAGYNEPLGPEELALRRRTHGTIDESEGIEFRTPEITLRISR